MLDWDQRYVNFPPHLHPYLIKAEQHALDLIKDRPWIKTGLEKQVWKDTGVYPSLVGSALRTLKQFDRCWIRERRGKRLMIVKKNRYTRIPAEFDEQLERIDNHLQRIEHHANTLEVLVNLALLLIRNEKKYDIYIKPDHHIAGIQLDGFFQYRGIPVSVEMKNKTGDTSPNNVNEYLEKCKNLFVRPMMIVTWMNDLAQKSLIAANGYFSNICRLYMTEAYPEISTDFQENGFKNLFTTLDFTRWGWTDATEAKQWLNKKFIEREIKEIVEKAKTIFNEDYKNQDLSHLYKKVNGTFTYSFLKIHTKHIIDVEKDLTRFGTRKFNDRDHQRLLLTSTVYLNMLFSQGIARKTDEITQGLSRSGYLKKQSIETRNNIIEGILGFLRDYKVITKATRTKWIVNDAKSPYINRTDIF